MLRDVGLLMIPHTEKWFHYVSTARDTETPASLLLWAYHAIRVEAGYIL
jgi:hypothetical protein